LKAFVSSDPEKKTTTIFDCYAGRIMMNSSERVFDILGEVKHFTQQPTYLNTIRSNTPGRYKGEAEYILVKIQEALTKRGNNCQNEKANNKLF
jgi:hypothetical protein